jgi:hypothetical protein
MALRAARPRGHIRVWFKRGQMLQKHLFEFGREREASSPFAPFPVGERTGARNGSVRVVYFPFKESAN